MANLLLQDLIQEGPYHYRGIMKLTDIADTFRNYPFCEEVREKARIQRSQMEACGFIPEFTLTIRVNPDFLRTTDGGSVLLQCTEFELIDGRSKTAAAVGLESDLLGQETAFVQIFAVTREKMDALISNRP